MLSTQIIQVKKFFVMGFCFVFIKSRDTIETAASQGWVTRLAVYTPWKRALPLFSCRIRA